MVLIAARKENPVDAPFELHASSVLLPSGLAAVTPAEAVDLSIRARTAGPFFKPLGHVSIDEARQRRSAYNVATGLEMAQLAELLHLAMFDTDSAGKRPYPAAGAIYAVQVYLAAYHVNNLEAGVYYVRWSEAMLERVDTAESAERFRDDAVLQPGKEEVPLIALLVADTRLSHRKYHERSTRFALIEAGCLLQTLSLAAAKLKLTVCGLGAISDRAALRLCQMQPHDQVVFACGMAIGGSG